MPDAATMNGLVQHAVVSAVALGALAVVLRRVLGVFERRPPASSPGVAHRGAATAPREPQRRRNTHERRPLRHFLYRKSSVAPASARTPIGSASSSRSKYSVWIIAVIFFAVLPTPRKK